METHCCTCSIKVLSKLYIRKFSIHIAESTQLFAWYILVSYFFVRVCDYANVNLIDQLVS